MELKEEIKELKDKLENLQASLEIDQKLATLNRLEDQIEQPEFWSDPSGAKKVLKEVTMLKNLKEKWNKAREGVSDIEVLQELASESGDQALISEAVEKVTESRQFLSWLEFQKMLSGPQDVVGAFLQINAGAGGTESCDWAAIMLRMYLRFCESKGYQAHIVDFTEGDGAGYRSVTVAIEGSYAYGYLKAEMGVHRLVRISPFDANKRRHTSFASVYVYPDVEEEIDIEINEADLRVDTYRAGGAGGQKVNKTDSAVRMTHLPTGIVVQCQNERSQHQNRALALKMLKARLFEREMEKKNAEKALVEAGKKDIAWGSQIRSYVLQPYQMVKDHRTNYETGNTQSVLDGNLEEFMRQYLLM